ncbi:hypothetical protein CKAH01_04045 [Colletotrichum kahawae]|uniref:Uncharacterized protein n=1 Tax=Colletotrichum kahawae TaxID=34407 RepID=A0AAE0D9T0_COLKA|nr:hypothetical protein CKAH01_04045 [Colletotrichum kahawae]
MQAGITMSSFAISFRDLLEGHGDHPDYFPHLHTNIKLSNAKKPSVAAFIKTGVIVPQTAKPFPSGFWDFTGIVDDEDLDDHYLNAVLEIIRRRLPHLSEDIEKDLKLRFSEQQTVNVVVNKQNQAFKPDGQLDLEGSKPDGSKQAVAIFEAKAEKIVARAIETIREMLAGDPDAEWDERCTLLLQQVGSYCILLNSRYGILYDDDCLIFIRFDSLEYTDGKPDFLNGLGKTCSIEVVEERSC